jgi:hypothetical protein
MLHKGEVQLLTTPSAEGHNRILALDLIFSVCTYVLCSIVSSTENVDSVFVYAPVRAPTCSLSLVVLVLYLPAATTQVTLEFLLSE